MPTSNITAVHQASVAIGGAAVFAATKTVLATETIKLDELVDQDHSGLFFNFNIPDINLVQALFIKNDGPDSADLVCKPTAPYMPYGSATRLAKDDVIHMTGEMARKYLLAWIGYIVGAPMPSPPSIESFGIAVASGSLTATCRVKMYVELVG